jgi:hypothetical protein
VAAEVLENLQVGFMANKQSSSEQYFEWFKNILLIGVGLPLIPILFPIFLIYLAFQFLVGAIEMSFKIFLRIIFPPLLMIDLWHLFFRSKR